jgi:hypothetical protein
MSIITCPLTFESGALFEARISKLNPSADPTFYARLLADETAVQHPAWKALEAAIKDTASEKWGAREYAEMVKNNVFRSPIRRDVTGKPFPAGTVAFLNLKCDEDHPPVIVGRDALPIMDRAAIYPGCSVRVSARPFAWGGKNAGYGAGVSLGLVNVQKLADGPRLQSASGDGSEFGPVGDVASLL